MARLQQGRLEAGKSLSLLGSRENLLAIARALIPETTKLSCREQALLAGSTVANHEEVVATRLAVLCGEDPLGAALCALRTAKERRTMGAVYTPPEIVRSMVNWAAGQGDPVRVVDPGAGSGRFVIAAGCRFPKAELVAIDTDPVALLFLRATAEVHGLSQRLRVHCQDYRKARLGRVSGPTIYIGNPPFVRHHDIGRDGKDWFGRTAASIGIKASKLAGLHIHFFLRTHEISQPGDYGAFVTSSEWLDVNYGSALREMLADGLGGVGIHLLAADAMPFEATTTGVVTTFYVGNRAADISMRACASLAELGDLEGGHRIPWSVAETTPRWTILTRGNPIPVTGLSELGEVFNVHRGQVTGANSVWIAGTYPSSLPDSVLYPSVTKARELIAAGDELRPDAITRLRSVIDIPLDLSVFNSEEHTRIEQFLRWARKAGAPKGYVASHRKAWWSVALRDPAPILCTYMARRAPVFVCNPGGVRHLNIAHGLYPRDPMDPETIRAYARVLRSTVVVGDGRTYAGGLAKFEPGEVERLQVPRPECLMRSHA